MRRIYLDNAATSWPKPEAVYQAVDRYLRENGAPFGRGAYAEAVEAARMVESARRALAQLLGVRDANRLVFCFNGTDALNLAIHGMLRDGDHVVTTAVEHNSVLRPLRALEDAGRISVTRIGCGATGLVDPGEIAKAITQKTRLVVASHASNVTGAIQPIESIRDIARKQGAYLLVDAAQTAGHLPLALDDWGCDLVAISGHKGLLGPLGTGLLYLREGLQESLQAFRLGGTGTRSDDEQQPSELPQKYESGNLNLPGIVGQQAAAAFLIHRNFAEAREHELQLTAQLLDGLREISGLTIHGPKDAQARVGLVSFNLEGYDPQEIAMALDMTHRIQVRSGLHCAPRMHEQLGTLATGGTIRMSLGWSSTADDVDAAVQAVAELGINLAE